jgi:hypothetical protein
MKFLSRLFLFTLLFIAICCTIGEVTGQKIIPDNIAFGAATKGGLNGQVIRVTTLDATGPGSLHEAIVTQGPRIIVFEVGGIIDLKKGRLEITEPYLTIAGQTAPSPGITIIQGGIGIRTHDVIMKHIRVRPGDAGQPNKSGWEPDGLATSGGNAYNIIIDHCSFTWAVDENLSASGARTEGPDSTSHKITFSNNIIAEGLDNSSHQKGPHSKGTLIHDFCRDIAIAGNLYAHNAQRNPYFKAFTTGVIVNNLIYNPGNVAIQLGYVDSEWENSMYEPKNCKVNIVGNVLIKGQDSRDDMAMIAKQGDAYLRDNLAFDQDGKSMKLTRGEINILQDLAAWPADFHALPSGQVKQYVVSHAGARPNDRDKIDRRIIQDFLERKGWIIDSQDDVGGYPKYEKSYRRLYIPENDIERWLLKLAAELESDVEQEKSPISISLQRPNFATMINTRHGGNRIGYRFHEHEPISYGSVPIANKDAGTNIEKIQALEESYKNCTDVFIYKHKIEKDSLWSKQDWTYYLKPVQDGVEMLLIIETYDEGLPAYYGIQQCFRMSGETNQEWRKEIANTPAFSEYDQWNSQLPNAEKKSLTYVLRDNNWQAIPASEKSTGARTPIGVEIDDLRTNGQPMSEVGPYKAKMLNPIDNGLITRVNLPESWVCGIHWQYTSHVTDHHPADCLHSIINIGDIPPFSKKAILGKIYWFEGNKDSLYDHYQHDLMDSGQK